MLNNTTLLTHVPNLDVFSTERVGHFYTNSWHYFTCSGQKSPFSSHRTYCPTIYCPKLTKSLHFKATQVELFCMLIKYKELVPL